MATICIVFDKARIAKALHEKAIALGYSPKRVAIGEVCVMTKNGDMRFSISDTEKYEIKISVEIDELRSAP